MRAEGWFRGQPAKNVASVPATPEKHCAKAGETPSAVIMPAAAARLRSAPPVRMLVASSRARRWRGSNEPEICTADTRAVFEIVRVIGYPKLL